MDILKIQKPSIKLEDADYSLSSTQKIRFQQDFLKGVPFAYLIGQVEFCGHHFKVSKDTLIPRPETEFLVDLLIQQRKKFAKAVDVGTGSGVILLSLMKAKIIEDGLGVDISSKALEICQENAWRLRLKPRLKLSDRLSRVDEKFDLIISNPPYIKKITHRHLVHEKVDSFEPEISLYLNDEIYDSWFLDFFSQVKMSLFSGGLFLMEGHELELNHQAERLKVLGFKDVILIKDLAQRDRFLSAKNP